MSKELSYRSFDGLELREVHQEEDSLILEGYIAKFDIETELFDGYFEKIDRSAFDETISDGHNIFLIYHHNYENILASTRNNTLILTVDEIGLRFKAIINKELSYANDVYTLVKSGEVRGCSFGFRINEEDYTYNADNDTLHSVLKRVSIYEGTITPIPAYENTEVFARESNLKELEKNKLDDVKENELRKRKLAIEIGLM